MPQHYSALISEPSLGDSAQSHAISENAHSPQESSQALNPFITTATSLLTLITQIKYSEENSTPDVNTLRKYIISEIKHYKMCLLKLEFNPRIVLAAQYCLCTAIDEAVHSTSWGTQSSWVQQSLLNLFHQETSGGERFYIILENLFREPRKNLAIIELLYILLSLGFEGKFFGKNTGVRDSIRSRLFQRIRQSHGKIERTLSPHWQDLAALEASKIKTSSLKKVLIGTASVFVIICFGFNVASYRLSNPTINRLNLIGRESPITAYSQLINRPIVPHNNPEL